MFRILTLVILALAACSKGPTAADLGTDAGDTALPDDASEVGGMDDDDASPPMPCAFGTECGSGSACIDDVCTPMPGCSGVNDWQFCVRELEAFGPEVALRAMCGTEGTCHVACLEDTECPAGQTCTDYGYCRPFGGVLDAPRPGGGPRAPLRAGVANTLMTFPIGISMAGFGSRVERASGRYTDVISASVGQLHGLYARAFALDNGERQLVVVRLPIIFASSWLHEAVARRLHDETGLDWRDSLVISATHSHSGPARFWPLADDAALDVGRLGSDSYHHVAFEWIVQSTVDAVLAALDDLAPARFGWTIVEAFDTDDAIASDRWDQTPPFDDNRLLLLRIDDASGVPRAAAVSLGMHSTFNDSDYLTGDAAAGIERQLELALGEQHDRFVPVLFLNENGGTMSPRGGGRGHESLHKHEYLGHEFTRRSLAAFDGITTRDDVSLGAQTHIFPINYRRVGYEIGEWARGNAGTHENTFFHGAIQCLSSGDDDVATHADPYDFFCLPVHFMSQNRPPTVFARSIITALELDGLRVVTMPGEVSMEVGWQVLREARDRLGLDPAQAFVWGYAQDHQLYITPTNLRGELPSFPGISTPQAPDDYPDFAFSWLQGGYEPSLSVWGHKFGDFMVERAIEALALLADPDLPVDGALPAQYTPFTTEPFGVEPSPADALGLVVEDVPATVRRLEPVEFAWVGGDPGVEMPQAPLVALEHLDAGSFVPFLRANRRPYDNREPVMLTRVRRNGDRWEWVVYWEEVKSFASGTYRFRAQGHEMQDGARTPYEATSAAFALGPAVIDVVATKNGATISGTLAYPAAAPLVVVGDDVDPGRVTGSFRMRHPEVPTGSPDPVETSDIVELRIDIHDPLGTTLLATLTLAEISVQTTGTPPATTFTASPVGVPAAYQATIVVTDRWGNSGVANIQ